jgi:GTP-binding protein HflX
VRELAEVTHDLGRRVGVLVDRSGEVREVLVGDATTLDLPELDLARRGPGRLKGLRWIAAAFGDDEPSHRDLTALVRARLDLLVVVAVDDAGRPWSLREAHVVPIEAAPRGRGKADETEGVATEVSPPLSVHATREGFTAFIEELEARLEKAAPAARATGAGQGERAILAVVGSGERRLLDERIAELRELAKAAGAEVVGELTQRRDHLDRRTLLGKGRVDDLCALVLGRDAELVVIDPDLAPAQHKALEDAVGVKVIDRTQLILDIFAQRARTRAGKLQVEAARLRYLMPRLVGRGRELSQLGGGIGSNRGVGETQLELDRRALRRRIDALEAELEKLARQRTISRRRRERSALPHVAIVGTTNVGKSTLFNRITDATVSTADRMFETLDPTVRRRRLPSGRTCLFSDTVGFLRELPKDLVQAFAATLAELHDARLLLHVADASDRQAFERIEQVRALLAEQGLTGARELLVFNKKDKVDAETFLPLARGEGKPLLISALEGQDVESVVKLVDDELAALDREEQAAATASESGEDSL